MGAFGCGQIVILPFPFSDLSHSKHRPALLIACAGQGDWIACQITSNAYADKYAVVIEDGDFASGSLHRESYARPGKLFTAHESIFADVAGQLQSARLDTIRNAVILMVQGEIDRGGATPS